MSATALFTVAEFDQMIERGIFENGRPRRVELFRGELRESMCPAGERHETAIDQFLDWSMDHAPREEVRVRIQNTVGIPELNSVPVPDGAWVRRRNYVRLRPRASDVLLLMEASDSSLRYDRNDKGLLYAAVGIEDYWIVNIQQQCIEVYRKPAADGYQEKTTYHLGEFVSPLKYPDLKMPVDLMFPPPEEPDET